MKRGNVEQVIPSVLGNDETGFILEEGPTRTDRKRREGFIRQRDVLLHQRLDPTNDVGPEIFRLRSRSVLR